MPPWAPKPGARIGPLKARSAGLADRGPDDGAEGAERLGAGVERAQVVQDALGDRLAGVGARVLDLGPLLVGGEGQHEEAGAVAARGVDERVERAEAEERADGDGVGGQRAGRVEVGVGVGLRGGADVAALDVEQHQRAGGAGLGHDALEHGDAARAEALVERRLRLDHRAQRRDGLDHRQRERLEPGDVVVEAPVVQQRGVRVDADAERAASASAASKLAPKLAVRQAVTQGVAGQVGAGSGSRRRP